MANAPLISTIIAIVLILVAFLFLHAFLSSLKKWKYYQLTGTLATLWDLSISIGYMTFRSFGGKV